MVGKYAFAFNSDNPNLGQRKLKVRVKPGPTLADKEVRSAKRRKTADSNSADDGSSADSTLAYEISICGTILAGASEWFRRKLEAYQKPDEPLIVEVEAGKADLFKQLVKFMYSEQLETDNDTEALQLLLLANEYGVEDCVSKCSELLNSGGIALETAIQVCALTSQQDHGKQLQDLSQKALARIMDEFGELDKVVNEEALWRRWLQLPFGVVKMLLASDDLRVDVENTVFSAAGGWLFYCGEPQEVTMSSFQVRYCHMTASYLCGVVRHYDEDCDPAVFVKEVEDAMAYKCTHPVIRQFVAERNSGIQPPRQHYASGHTIKSHTCTVKVPVAAIGTLACGDAPSIICMARSETIRLGGYTWHVELQRGESANTLGIWCDCCFDPIDISTCHEQHDYDSTKRFRDPKYAVAAKFKATVHRHGRAGDAHFKTDIRPIMGPDLWGFPNAVELPAEAAGVPAQSFVDRMQAAGYIIDGHFRFTWQVEMPLAQ
ncbi:hypothetical protein WJX72_004645 [[Myrmecia] bisecta]|uniref:BTB domain-containing protein n=1 Tax=[Myrmecia] bisecta TaxID=41462 RepID=A0AAW1PXR2_9CHLO